MMTQDAFEEAASALLAEYSIDQDKKRAIAVELARFYPTFLRLLGEHDRVDLDAAAGFVERCAAIFDWEPEAGVARKIADYFRLAADVVELVAVRSESRGRHEIVH